MNGSPPGRETLEMRLTEAKQLFLAIDAAPFRERDLDPRAEAFIVEWAQELPRDASLALVIRLERPSPAGNDAELIPAAISEYFRERARATRLRLRELLRTGRTSLLIGLAFNALMLTLAGRFGDQGFVRESFVIGGWVAMWRPLEVFLYDWWPIRDEARFYDRLAAMPVQVLVTPAR